MVPAPAVALCANEGPRCLPERENGGHWKPPRRKRTTLIKLQQDADGFIRMNRHFPENLTVTVIFADGATEEFPGRRLNRAYDDALAEYRAQNHLDAKGFQRGPRKKTGSGNKIDFVRVYPGVGRQE